MKEHKQLMKIAFTGLMAALSYVVFTFLQIRIPLPGGDATSIHLGNAICVLGALLLGGLYGGLGGAIGMTIGDLLDPVQNHRRSVIIIICHHDIVASVQQFDAGVAADVAGTAGNQNCHSRVPLSYRIITFISLRRALSGLFKAYRFLPPTARGAFFIQIYFCCIFFQYTFD